MVIGQISFGGEICCFLIRNLFFGWDLYSLSKIKSIFSTLISCQYAKACCLVTLQAQVHLLGNLAIWTSGSLCVLLYSALLCLYLLRRRRLCRDISEDSFLHFCSAGEVLLGGYLLHFAPFFFYDRTLFVSHYLPAYVFKVCMGIGPINRVIKFRNLSKLEKN